MKAQQYSILLVLLVMICGAKGVSNTLTLTIPILDDEKKLT